MTVGIGVICEGGKAVVLVADRMVTIEAPHANYEGQAKKIMRIGPHAAVALSGTFSDASYVIRHTDVPRAEGTIEQIAEEVLLSRIALRRRVLENLYTKRFLAIDLEEFGKRDEKSGNVAYREVFLKMHNHLLQLHFLIAGVDHVGAQLFTINDATAIPTGHRDIGFCAIGSGHAEAHVSLARREYQASWSLAEAVYGAYEAKRAAELAPGVGDATDIAVIAGKKRPRFLKARAIDELAKIYKESRKPMRLSESQRHRLVRHLG